MLCSWRAIVALGLVAGAGTTEAAAQEVLRRVGSVTFRVDTSQAFPGGVVVVRLASRGRLGSAWALLDGRRAAFYSDRGVPRALVPVAASAEAGPATLGVGIAARRGEQRVSIPITIAPREYRPRYVFLPEEQRARLRRPEAAHDGRRLLAVLRTESPKPAPGLLLPPVGTTGTGFGELRTYTGAADVESRIDALQGERHRGLDYAVPVGTPVRAPSAGTVLFAGSLALSGETVVIDHGQGVLSVLQHLSRVDARVGDLVAAAAIVGLSGDSGLAPEPMLQWRVYLHAVPVDPTVLGPLL
ncbi:MAG TPA: M23 family metallopeptidase [Vicinamibacteria bacterium]|nr:M23 family metallopeptidase [Vicinamibacteria bacterium]